MWRQQLALMLRFRIVILDSKISRFIDFIVWPGFVICLAYYLLSSISPTSNGSDGIFSSPYQYSIIALFAITFPLYGWLADRWIRDKEFGMKKLMLSMGLGRFDYYCANSICFQLLVLPFGLAIAILTKVYLLNETVSWLIIILLYTLFALHLESAASFFVSFIVSRNYSLILLVLVILDWLWAAQILDSDAVHRPIELFLSSVSPYQPVRIFVHGNMKSHGTTESNGAAQDLSTIFTEQIVWIIFLRLFACWFEEVCPWQKVSAVMGPCFCFQSQQRYQNENIEDSIESIAITSKYFEQRAQNRDVGIRIRGVTKVFGGSPAVSDVSFSIYKGETTLLLGHNGAGKTTLMNVIIGWLNPDRGHIEIRSGPGGLASVGVCPQTSILEDILTVRQHLELFNDIKSNISGPERERHIQQTIDDVCLAEHADKRPPELSGGMKRKLSLAMALVGKSDVLILDEPSSGLDPDSRVLIWNAIRRYRADRTVLLSTQHMEEADYLGDRIAIMRGGQIVCCGSSVYLNKLFGTGYKLRIECKQSKTKEILDHIEGYFDCAQVEERVEIPAKGSMTDGNVDFIVELKMKDEKGDEEMQLIKLLQDLEGNSSELGVYSFGLKSSSTEDVMLNSNKYFSGPKSEAVTQKDMVQNVDQISKILTQPPSRSKIIRALCIKQLQVYRVQWFSVLLLKVILPMLAISRFINGFAVSATLWQSPIALFIIRHFVRFPAKEHASKFKIVQLESGATVWLYWLSQIMIDFLFVAIYLVGVNRSLKTTLEANFLVPEWQVRLLLSLATLMFCLASMMFCYMMSAISRNAGESTAYVSLIFVASSLICRVLDIWALLLSSEVLMHVNHLIGYLFLLLIPGDAYSYTRSGLATDCYIQTSESSDSACIPSTGPSRVMLGLAALAFHTLLYAGLLYAIEMHKIDLAWYLRPRNILSCMIRKAKLAASSTPVETDKDVEDENEKALHSIKSPTIGSNSLTAAKLNKSYYKDTKIIQDLSFTVKKGECFGLLGVNGAGKSTAFSMLAAETRPDSGRILANGQYLDEDLHKYRSTLGYDPQSNPEMSLTAYQALSLMARLRGVEESRIPALVESISDMLEMHEHINKSDSQLSGGTKRKVALGMALIGNPSILLLDEPTAGVDPFARRGVWRLLRLLKERSNVSVAISSHAMEECEAICDRIAIMARGRLRCIGSFLHLRSRFAGGCTLRVHFSIRPEENSTLGKDSLELEAQSGYPSNYFPLRRQPERLSSEAGLNNIADSSMSELKQLLDSAIGSNNYKLSDENVTSLTLEIMDSKVKRSILFETMRQFRRRHPNVSYVINDLSLEDIFIAIAREERTGIAHSANIA